MNRTFAAMGTVVSLARVAPEQAAEAEALFATLEARFSLFRPESELSKLARGELVLTRASTELRELYELAHDWRAATEGAFNPQRPDGVVDLTGIVKAVAIQGAGEILGRGHWAVNAGGDILSGTLSGQAPWVVGIADPDDRGRLVSQFRLTPELPALATSGYSERGQHIWRLGADATFTQVSVAAPDIVTADVLATAILAGGPDTLDKAVARWPIEVLALTADATRAAPAFRTAGAAT